MLVQMVWHLIGNKSELKNCIGRDIVSFIDPELLAKIIIEDNAFVLLIRLMKFYHKI